MRTFQAKVHPGSSRKEVIEVEGVLHCYLRAKPQKGEANKEAVELLAKYLKIPKSSIELKQGGKSRLKTFQINE